MRIDLRFAWDLLKQTFQDWSDDKAPRLGAALAFYTALSIAPLLVISLKVVSLFFATDIVQKEIERQMHSMVGEEGGVAAHAMLSSSSQPTSGTIGTVLSLITLLFGASGVFGQLQDSLNTIWEVAPKPGRGILGFLRDRFFSMTMVMGMAFLLLASLLVSATISFSGSYVFPSEQGHKFVGQVLEFSVSLAIFTGIFAMMFKYLPDAKIAWRDVWAGAAMTAVLFTIGKSIIGIYLGHSSMASSYGAAGSLIVLLVWVYYSAQIVLFGAEFTQVWANRFGEKIVPSDDADHVPNEARTRGQTLTRAQDSDVTRAEMR